LAASQRGGGVPSAQDPLGPSSQWASQLDSLVGKMRRNQRFAPPQAEPAQTVQVARRPDQGYPTGNRYGTAWGQSGVSQQQSNAPGDQALPSADDWLLHAQRSPAAFANELFQLTLAEQELWIGSLARHAARDGSLDMVISALRSSQSEHARVVGLDFRVAGERLKTAAVDAGD
jgi:hypothetical protein